MGVSDPETSIGVAIAPPNRISPYGHRASVVLLDLLARADARAGELAKAYDRARIAGLSCEASYNALTP